MDKNSYVEVPNVMIRGYGAFSGVSASADALLGADLVVVALTCDQPPSEGELLQLPF